MATLLNLASRTMTCAIEEKSCVPLRLTHMRFFIRICGTLHISFLGHIHMGISREMVTLMCIPPSGLGRPNKPSTKLMLQVLVSFFTPF